MSDKQFCPKCKRYHGEVSKQERDALLLEHSALVKRVATKLFRNMPQTIELDDLVSVGTLGLVRAIEHYDKDSPVHFETYAVSAIRSAIADEMRKQDWAPRSLRRRQKDIERATRELERQLERTPTVEELADKLGQTSREVERTQQAVTQAVHKSLDESSRLESSPYEQIADSGQSPEQQHSSEKIRELVADLIKTFPRQDQLVIALYYFEGLTLQEIGLVAGIPESRASQIHKRVVLDVRRRLLAQLA